MDYNQNGYRKAAPLMIFHGGDVDFTGNEGNYQSDKYPILNKKLRFFIIRINYFALLM